jgi:hypothetical protein
MFNHELVERMKHYSLSRNGEVISDETAIEHLDALADFYEAFSGLVQNKKSKRLDITGHSTAT